MNDSDRAPARNRFSILSLLTLVAFAALVFVALRQHQQDRDMQHRIETLSSQVQHLEASNEETQAKFEQLVELVRAEPVMEVTEVPTTQN